jgi:hypothetical protein
MTIMTRQRIHDEIKVSMMMHMIPPQCTRSRQNRVVTAPVMGLSKGTNAALTHGRPAVPTSVQ